MEEHEPDPWLLYSTMAGFPHLGNSNILSQAILYCRVLSYACKMSSSLYQLDTSSTQPHLIIKNNSRHCQTSSWGGNHPLLRTSNLHCTASLERVSCRGLDAPSHRVLQRVANCGTLTHVRLTGQERKNLTLVPKKKSCQDWVYYIWVRVKRLTWKPLCSHSISHGYWEHTPFLEIFPSQYTEHKDWSFAETQGHSLCWKIYLYGRTRGSQLLLSESKWVAFI